MQRTVMPVVAFSLILIAVLPLSFDFATSVIPGWHVALLSPYFLGATISGWFISWLALSLKKHGKKYLKCWNKI